MLSLIVAVSSLFVNNTLQDAVVESALGDGTVYMIRHGEKDSEGCESSKGMERANALHDIFKSNFQLPDFIYAYHYTHDCQRTTQTITPLAKSLGLTVDTHHGSDSDAAVKAFVHRLSSDKVIVACWEHEHIPKVAAAFGVPSHNIPHWSGSDYDSVFIFTIKSGKLVDFKVSAEHFHPKVDLQDDDEKPSNCPGGLLSHCIDLCPSHPPTGFKACVAACASRCSLEINAFEESKTDFYR